MKKLTKAGIGLGAVAAVSAASALVVFAWGPSGRATFTMEKPASYVTFNSITNNVIGDERYFVSASKWTGSAQDNYFSDTTTVEDGKEYVVRMYVHNNAGANLNLVAENVKAFVVLPTETNTKITVSGKITSSNANPTAVWDETHFVSKNGEKFNLAYVAGSATYANADKDGKLRSFKLGTELLDSRGVLLGYDQMDGKIPGCNKYSGYLTFHVKAQFAKPVETPNLSIQKEVKLLGTDTWSEQVKAKSGDTVRYRIQVKNTGNTTLSGVVVRDNLPANLEYIKGTTTIVNANHPTPVTLSDNLVSTNGINIGDYAAGANAVLYFNAKVKAGVSDKCTNTLLRNVAETSAGKATGTKSDTADVLVDGKVCTEGFTLDKKVRLGENAFTENITAKAGDKVEYRIQFKNTGNVDLNNVVIRDILPSNETYVKGSTNLDGKKLADGVISTDGINIGTVAAGKTVNLYFFVTMNSALADICEKVELTNTAKAKYNNDAKTEKSDTAVVSVNGKDCREIETPGFTINKMVQLKGGNTWAEDVTAKAGNTVRYRIQFKNTGNTTLKNVVIRDILPNGISYVKGSTVLYNAANTNGKTLGDGIVSADGINIGDYAKGTEATVYFYATVNTPADECKDSTLRNVAKGKYNNDAKTEKSDTADVTVNKIDCSEPDEPEIPKTGASEVITSVIGAASVATAAGYYIISRKKLN
ncbi:MAG: LPXTG cell wall anchor domain-containing protein [Candidatus Saccharibacteria bacterium]|nr:LPXTG cell wall anchor domain-containing protein [Candidatus Saccharibacteria bacterium]